MAEIRKYILGARQAFLLAALLSAVSCDKPYVEPQPPRPKVIDGWRESESGGVHFLADLLLSEGELSDDGSLGVRVLSISPEHTRVGTFSEPPPQETTVRVYRVADGKEIFEGTIGGGLRTFSEPATLHTGKRAVGLFIDGINTKERWVHLDLRE